MTQDEGSTDSTTQRVDTSQRSGVLDDDDDVDEEGEYSGYEKGYGEEDECASGNLSSQDDGNLSQPGDPEFDELVQLHVVQPTLSTPPCWLSRRPHLLLPL